MNFNKKNIIMYSILAVIILSFVLAVNHSKEKETTINEESIAIKEVVDRKEFFNINNIVNMYYENISNENYSAVLNILDSKYISEKEITKNNINKIVNYDYDNINFYSNKIYLRRIHEYNYYFITGEIHGYNFLSKTLEEMENICILVKIDRYNETYSITPISTNYSIEDYAKKYTMTKSNKILLNDDNEYLERNFSSEYIAKYYINYFNNILFLNREKSYTLLSDRYKKTFTNYNNYVKSISRIDNDLNAAYYSYNFTENEDSNVYTVNLLNLKTIQLIETSPMNFTIDISNGNI